MAIERMEEEFRNLEVPFRQQPTVARQGRDSELGLGRSVSGNKAWSRSGRDAAKKGVTFAQTKSLDSSNGEGLRRGKHQRP